MSKVIPILTKQILLDGAMEFQSTSEHSSGYDRYPMGHGIWSR